MKLLDLIKEEFKNFGKYERFLFPLVIFLIIVISIVIGDNKIALVSAVCGISYTILAGKGKISCYFIGMIGTFCYSYLSFVNGFWGNLALYMFYYFPMEIVGIYKWKKHFKKEVREVIKTRLSNKERIIYSIVAISLSLVVSVVLKLLGDSKPFLDGSATVFSILGQFLTVKRCIEGFFFFLMDVRLCHSPTQKCPAASCFAENKAPRDLSPCLPL